MAHNQISMDEWIKLINLQNTFKPESILEIGSMDGKDANYLEQVYLTNNVNIIEAHPQFYEMIKEEFPLFKVHHFAACELDGHAEFNAIYEDSQNLGISSLLSRDDSWSNFGCTGYNKVEVSCKKMKTFMLENNIQNIDILKIDVEGNSYEVLVGFEEMLKNVKTIHIENEHVQVWKNQKLYSDSEKILIDNGFILLDFKIGWPQSDSVWFKKEYVKKNWWIE
jgi:FkbM family methyltransferase